MSLRWASALKNAGTPQQLVTSWQSLRTAIASHQKLLAENGIGLEVSERDRVRVNARRVGLEAPLFADEAEATFADAMAAAFESRLGKSSLAEEGEAAVAKS